MPNEAKTATPQTHQDADVPQELDDIAQGLKGFAIRLYEVVATGIGGPKPPGPKHLEVLTKIVGEAKFMESTALVALTGHIKTEG